MAGPDSKPVITAPAYRDYPTIPALQPGATENVKSYVANEKIQEALGVEPGAPVGVEESHG